MSGEIYNEAVLVRDLGLLGVDARVAFAVSCAERLFPAYAEFSNQTGRGSPETLATLLERVWQHLLGERMLSEDISASLHLCMTLIPDESDGPWVDAQPYADDAATATAYALRALETGKAQEAAWAARRAYEAAGHHVAHRLGIKSEAMIRAHPVVVRETSRQRRDLDLLLAANQEPVGYFVRLRDRAKSEAFMFFGIA